MAHRQRRMRRCGGRAGPVGIMLTAEGRGKSRREWNGEEKGDNAVSTWFLRGSTVCGEMLCRLMAPG